MSLRYIYVFYYGPEEAGQAKLAATHLVVTVAALASPFDCVALQCITTVTSLYEFLSNRVCAVMSNTEPKNVLRRHAANAAQRRLRATLAGVTDWGNGLGFSFLTQALSSLVNFHFPCLESSHQM